MCNSGGDALPVPLTRSHKGRASARRWPSDRRAIGGPLRAIPVLLQELSSTDTVVGRPRQDKRHSKQQLDCPRRLFVRRQRQALDIFTGHRRFSLIKYLVVLQGISVFLPQGVACWHSPCFSRRGAAAVCPNLSVDYEPTIDQLSSDYWVNTSVSAFTVVIVNFVHSF
jgi:hypothetical protein